jgi:hypothetical protein
LENSELIIAISPHLISERHFNTKNRPIHWVYFGENYLSKIKIKSGLIDNFSELDISRLLEEVANEIRSEHVKWIDEINQKYGSELEWWFGNVASRNIYQSDLFQYCCYLVLLERLWKHPTKKPSLIVVDSPSLALAIYRWALEKKIHISIKGQYKIFPKKFIAYGKFGMRWLDFIIVTIMRMLASVVLNENDIIDKSHSCDMVMINTFVDDSSISHAGTFHDRYFPYLYEYLEKHNKIILIHPVFHGFHFNFFPIFKKISCSRNDFIIQEKYLKLEDYIYTLLHPIQLLRQNLLVSEFHDFNLTEIIHEDQMKADVQNILQAILTFRLMQRLKMNELKLHLFIDWYENQTLNRAIVAGVHHAFPGVKTIGAQIFLHYPNFISLSPTQSESKAGIVPDILLTTSPYQCGLARAFYPSLNCIPAAALRYAHVFTEEKRSTAISDSHKKIIHVLTSFNHDETFELLQMIQDIMKGLGDEVIVYVQFHPDIRKEEISKQYPEIQKDSRYTIFYGSLSDGIRDASVVVSKGSSSIVEAIAKGTPAIFVGNQNKLNLNPLAGISTPLFAECYSNDELRVALLKYLNLSDNERNEYRNLGKSIRDMFFLPVNEDTLTPFLAL